MNTITTDFLTQILQALKESNGNMILILRVTANSRKEGLVIKTDGTLTIKVAAPALENKANERIINLLSNWLKIARSAISIAKGTHAKNKLISLAGISKSQAAERLLKVALS